MLKTCPGSFGGVKSSVLSTSSSVPRRQFKHPSSPPHLFRRAPHSSQNRLSFWVDECIIRRGAPRLLARRAPPEPGRGSATLHRHLPPWAQCVTLPPEAIPSTAIASERGDCATCPRKRRAVPLRPGASATRRRPSKTVAIQPESDFGRSNIRAEFRHRPAHQGSGPVPFEEPFFIRWRIG